MWGENMKKNKIWLFILIGILTLCANNKVMAADGHIGYMGCTYSFKKSDKLSGVKGKGEDLLTSKYVKDQKQISFAYSEIKIGSTDLSNKVYLVYDGRWELTQKVYGENKLFGGILVKNLDDIYKTFKDASENNENTCPNYIVLLKANKASYNIHFYNKNVDDDARCGNDYAKCAAVGVLKKTLKPQFFYSEDAQKWHFYGDVNNSNVTCHGLIADMYINNRTFKANLYYDEETAADDYKKKKATVDVTLKDITPIDFAYNLFVNNQIYRNNNGTKILAKINKDHTGKFVIGPVFGAVDKTAGCTINIGEKEKASSTVNCTKYDDIQGELDAKQSEYNLLSINFGSSINKYLDKDYSNYDKASLINTESEIYSLMENQGKALESKLPDYATYVTDIYQNKVCKSDQKKVEEYLNRLEEYRSDLEDKLNAVADSYTKIEERAKKLNLTEAELQQISEHKQSITGIVESIKKYKTLTKVTNLLEGKVKITIREGCAVITTDFKDWLIQLLDIVKIAGLVLTIILGMIDFFKGVASEDADAMKKVTKNFSRRLIAVALLFLLPVIIEFILNIVNIAGVDANNPLCGIK